MTKTVHVALLSNTLKTTVRRLVRQPLYLMVGVGGLAVGMACCLLVLRYLVWSCLSIGTIRRRNVRTGWYSTRSRGCRAR